jgi:hypothetical protein
VADNLNTYSLASLYAAFEPEPALRLARRFGIHYTPKRGSRLNTAELETGALGRQRLGRGIPALEKTASEVQAWVTEGNNRKTAVQWQCVVLPMPVLSSGICIHLFSLHSVPVHYEVE